MSSKFSRGTRGLQHPSICIPPPPPPPPPLPPPPPPPPHASGYWCKIDGIYHSYLETTHLSGEVELSGDGATPQNWDWSFGGGAGPGRLYNVSIHRVKITYSPLVYGDAVLAQMMDDYAAAWDLVNETDADSIPTEINRHFNINISGIETFVGTIDFTLYP